ncbi:MAG TPA: DUF6325 family protein [Actinophytocola sp.]|uniref:DUF6325 family protein n=1 Tax=Actinophytocola sp. TaxID=1872138 RepID=UPI002DB93E95|nr:DUF6325 family protein [Actinophytocola sp.]HEU5473517.1 DUF6325 family protein [Actinophytocola sp.]
MPRGPLEYAIFEFPGNKFSGEIVPALHELVSTGVIRIVDLIFVKKDADGTAEAVELAALDPDEAAIFHRLDGEINGLVSQEDLELAAEELAPDSSAAVLVWENSWASRFIEAVTNANGRVVAHERIPNEVFEAALKHAMSEV